MPITKLKKDKDNGIAVIDNGYGTTENGTGAKRTFMAFKNAKKQRSLRERLECDDPYEQLSENDKRKYNILAGKAKYNQFLGLGCLGIAIATAVYNGQAVMGEDFLNLTYGLKNAIALTMAETLEYGFTNISESVLRAVTVFLPLYKFYDFFAKSDLFNAQAQEFLGTRKNRLTEKFVNKMAERYASKKALKEGGAVVNPFASEPEEVPSDAYPCEEEKCENLK